MRRSSALIASVCILVLMAPVSRAQPGHPGDHGPCHPTAKQRAWAADFAERTKEVAQRYESQMNALNDNYEPWVDSWKPVYHFVNYEHYYDWKVLDPERPEAYVYAHTLSGDKLIGVMYSMEDPDREPPTFGGCITQWHTHPQCVSPIGYSHIWEEDWGSCPPGWETDDGGSELMLHVWTVDMADGPYSYEPDPEWFCWPRPAPC